MRPILAFALAACAVGAEPLRLLWSRQLPERQPMWAWGSALPQDQAYRLVEAGDLVIVGTTADATLRAIRRSDGGEAWRFAFDGALRWWPTVAGDAVIAGSDDGTLACLAVADGALRWRYRPGPGPRQIIGHLRMQSSWPIVATPAVSDGAVYGMCGVFKEDGIWAFGVDLATGAERWLRRQNQSQRYAGRVAVADGRVGFASLGPGSQTSADMALALDPATGDPIDLGKERWRVDAIPRTALPRLRRTDDGGYVEAPPPASIDLAAAIAAGAASAIAVPSTWSLHGPMAVDERLDERGGIPGAAARAWPAAADGSIDLIPVYGDLAKRPGFSPMPNTEAVLVASVTMPSAGTLMANATADWWMRLSIAGTAIIDTLGTGNAGKPTDLAAQSGAIELPAGTHPVVLRLRPGTSGFQARLRLAVVPDPAAAAAAHPAGGALPPVTDPVDGTGRVIQASRQGGHLLLLTAGHVIRAFGPGAPAEPVSHAEPARAAPAPPPAALARAAAGAWVLVAGVEDAALAAALAGLGTAAHIVVADADPQRAAAARRRLDAAGLLADGRVQVVAIDPAGPDLPPWIFGMVVGERAQPWERMTRLIRPCGGVLFPVGGDASAIAATAPDLAAVQIDGLPAVRRPGLLAGAADWSHELADAANASGAVEPAVRFPLSVLWYGGPADARLNFPVPVRGILEGTTMQPMGLLVARGRWLLQGIGNLTAYDQYTGRQIWRHPLPAWYPYASVGVHGQGNEKEPWNDPIGGAQPVKPYDIPRTGGYNMCTDADACYVAAAGEILRFRLDDGAPLPPLAVPSALGAGLRWGTLRAADGALVATAFHPDDLIAGRVGWDGNGGGYAKDRQRMRHLAALDPRTGALRWSATAERGFINHGLAVGNGRVYALDLVDQSVVKGRMDAQAEPIPGSGKGTVAAYDLASGRRLWQVELPALLTDILYDAQRDQLLLPSRFAFQLGEDGLWKKTGAKDTGLLLALRGADGGEIYRRSDISYNEPLSLAGDRVIMRTGSEISAVDGARLSRPHPATGLPSLFAVPKGGCTWLIQSGGFSAYRSGWTDMANLLHGDFGGIDHGCVPTQIPAGGLVNISNVASTRFGNRPRSTSRALVHRGGPDTAWADASTVGKLTAAPGPVRRLGFLLGAPGVRADERGTWWVRTDGLGGSVFLSRPPVKDAPPAPGRVVEIAEHRLIPPPADSGVPPWAASFQIVGPGPLTLPTVVPAAKGGGSGRYRIAIVCAEPDPRVGPGQRVFSVACGDAVLAPAVDPVALAGRPRAAAVVRAEIAASGPQITITLTPAAGSLPAVIGGILLERIDD